MKPIQSPRSRPAGLRAWLATAAVLLAGLSVVTAVQAVNIKQAPLTSALQLQPNVTLMFDDSGSMRWSAMPDALSNTNVNQGLISASVNGVYYDPSVTYHPPYSSTAKPPTTTTRYPDSNYADAPQDGFLSGQGSTNIATYNTVGNPIPGRDAALGTCTGRCRDESVNFGLVHPAYTHTFQITVPEVYGFASAICNTGRTPAFSSTDNPGKCLNKVTIDPVCPTGYTRTGTGTAGVTCTANAPQTRSCPTNYTFDDNAASPTVGRCVRDRGNPVCNTTGYPTLINAGTVNAVCQSDTSTPANTCTDTSYTYNSSSGLCERVVTQSPNCSTSGGSLTGSGASTTCFATEAAQCNSIGGASAVFQATDPNPPSGNQKGFCRKGSGIDAATSPNPNTTGTCVAGSGTLRANCYVNSNQVCPNAASGFTLNQHLSDGTNARCEKSATPQCPAGYTYSTTAPNAGLCVQTQTQASTLTCAAPRPNLIGGLCYRNPQTIAPPSCSSASYSPTVTNLEYPGRCIELANPNSCPAGYQPSADTLTCVVLPSTTTPTCPAATNPSTPPYVADFSDSSTPGKCERFLPEDPICPTSRFSYTPNLLSDSTGGIINPNTSGVQCRGTSEAAYNKFRSLFTYAVLSGTTYTRHYVGAASEDSSSNGTATAPTAGNCASISGGGSVTITNTGETFTTGFPADRCHESDSIRQNVANWFTYYRTRLLMAKSGLMNAFADLDENIRYGFSSINAGTGASPNGSALPSPKTNTSYSQSISSTSYSPPIASVKKFGSGASDTRRGEFWSWLNNVTAPGSTPLRAALKATGDYYGTDAPWVSGTDAPECTGKTGSDLSTCGTRLLACRQSYTILVTDGYWNSDNITLAGSNYSVGGEDYGGDWDGGPGLTATAARTLTPTCSGTYNTLYVGENPVTLKGQCYRDTGRGSTCTSGSSTARNAACFQDTASCPSGYTLDKNTDDDNLDPVCFRPAGSTASAITNTGPNGLSYIYTGLPPYSGGQADNGSSTLADVAAYFWVKDLRSDLANSVPTNSDDPAFWQHMTTFTVGMFGQDDGLPNVSPAGTTADQIFAWARGGAAIPGFAWPTPSTSGSASSISDLVHAGLNGRGGFYSAGNPDAFASGIKDALRRVRDRVGSGASLAANSTKLDTGTTTFQAVYFSGEWRGNLKAFSVNPSSGAISTTPAWEAINQLPAAASRIIKTCQSTCTGDGDKINFDTTAATSAQRSALASSTAEQDALINYLRGSAASEIRNGGTLRTRSSPLGDIVNSQPVFVGAPDPNLYFSKTFTGSDTYFSFASAKTGRSKRIYVAANDGMLHGFNAETTGASPSPGEETFAYLPSAVITGNVKNLANPAYGFGVPHEFFHDGELTVADAYLSGHDSCSGVSCWRSVLVGTTGRGLSKAIYALDVTDPADVKLLWERDAADSTYIGQIVGKPVIAQTSNGVWSVLIGNGYNSAHNKPALLQFNLRTGALTVYETTGGATNDGLAPPAVWNGNVIQNVSTEAYAGDLNGNVWKFDLTTPGSSGSKIYIAKDASGNVQPITAGLIAGRNPKVKTESEVWVFFGTGTALEDFSPSSLVQTWYGLIVQGANAVSSGGTRSGLKQRTIDVQFAADSTRPLATRGISSAAENDMNGKKGWYLDLLKPTSGGTQAQGERMVTPNQFQGSLLLGTSRVPVDSANFDPCNPTGSGWIMVVDPFTGAPPGSNFFDINNDGDFDNDDNAGGGSYVSAGIGFDSIPNNPIFVGNTMLISFDNATTGSVNTRGSVGVLRRQSWREMVTP